MMARLSPTFSRRALLVVLSSAPGMAAPALAEFHLRYESGPEYPLVKEVTSRSGQPDGRISASRAMRLAGEDDLVLIVIDRLRRAGIPAATHRYEANGRTPLRWFTDRHRVTGHRNGRIANDPTAWLAGEVALLAAPRRIVYVSIETTGIVDSLPYPLNE